MNRRTFLRYSGCALAAMAEARGHAETRRNSVNIPVVLLEGSPRERGRTHGETLRSKIVPFVEAWKIYHQVISGMPASGFVADFLGNTRFAEAMRQWTPDLLEELHGIAEGAGVDFDTLLAFNLPDELDWYQRYKQKKPSLSGTEHCSSLGFERGGYLPPIIGQNMDIPCASEGFEVLLHIKYPDSEREAYLFSVAGMLGIVGLNNAPVGVVNNALDQLDVRPDGLPVNAVVRGMLAKDSYEDALGFLKHVPHATGHNYILGGPKAVSCFECSAKSVVEFTAERFPGAVYHTNHPFVNRDQGMFRATKDGQEHPNGSPSSRARCEAIETRLPMLSGPINVAALRSILSSRDNPEYPVCVPHKILDPAASFTAACLIMELTTPPILHLAPGPPCETSFKTYCFG